MVRRSPYTKVVKENEIRADHVRGMGDVVFKGFQCLNGECEHFIFVRKDDLAGDYRITCPACGYIHRKDGEETFYDYRLTGKDTGEVLDEGSFVVKHAEYIGEAAEYKYCIICNALKPIDSFGRHGARKSARQGECTLCKRIYNTIKNPSRISDQHREAAQRRRLYNLLSGESGRIDSRAVFERFGGRCFSCGRALVYRRRGKSEFSLDHTLPARYFWPIDTGNATLLCGECNNQKHDLWPAEYYPLERLKALSRLTGIEYGVLAGRPFLNPEAVRLLLSNVDSFIEDWIRHPEEIKKVRELILAEENVDIFESASTVPGFLLE